MEGVNRTYLKVAIRLPIHMYRSNRVDLLYFHSVLSLDLE